MSGHHCHAFGCEVPTRPTLFVCARHWALVPKVEQQAILDAYRPGQCKDKRPSKAYTTAALRARLSIARAEGHEQGIRYCEHTLKMWEEDA